MPILDALREALRIDPVSSAHVIVVNPSDYPALVAVLDRPRGPPDTPVTLLGVRVYQRHIQPQGTISIIRGEPWSTYARFRSPPMTIADGARLLDDIEFQIRPTFPNAVLSTSGRINIDAAYVDKEEDELPPEPRSLWERLEGEDE